MNIGCAVCFGSTPQAAWDGRRDRLPQGTLVEESHFSVRLCACRACGQRYVDVFCERIDWVHGEDPQDWLIVPITAEEAALLATADPERAIPELAPKRRCLVACHPSDEPRWVRFVDGPYSLPHHD